MQLVMWIIVFMNYDFQHRMEVLAKDAQCYTSSLDQTLNSYTYINWFVGHSGVALQADIDILSPFTVNIVNVIANSCLFTYPGDNE